jgi:hypothetical protein
MAAGAVAPFTEFDGFGDLAARADTFHGVFTVVRSRTRGVIVAGV